MCVTFGVGETSYLGRFSNAFDRALSLGSLDGPTRWLVAHIDETLHALAYGCQRL